MKNHVSDLIQYFLMKITVKLVNRPLISEARNCSGESPGTNTDKLRTTI